MTRALDRANIQVGDSPLSHRNLIINGAMMVDQRDTSSATTANATYKIDRFKTYYGNGPVHSVQRVTDTPTNLSDFFKHSMKIVQTTASGTSTPGTDDYNFFQYGIEGQDMAHLKFGASQAQTFTMSFYVKSSVAGVYSVGLSNASFDRSFSKKYTITSADTWERITLTFTGDTTGTWASDNTAGLYIRWNLGGGTDRTQAEGSWTSGYQDGADGSTGANSFSNTLNAEYYITGVQLELGDSATPFEHRSYGEELLRCQRYLLAVCSPVDDHDKYLGTGFYYTSSYMMMYVSHPVDMRTDPTIESTNQSNAFVIYRNGGSDTFDDMTINSTTLRGTMLQNNSDMSGTAGQAGGVYNGTVGGKILLKAEL